MVGNWDDMPIFRRRAGGNLVGQEDEYYREHTEEAVKKLKDLGVTMAIIHFYKAFGIEAEKEQMEDSKKLASLCHKYGIKVGVYVGSTIGYETFLLEKPEAKDWFVPDYMGQPVVYGNQTFRKRVYFMHPGYMEYIKRVIRIAIEDLKVDLIHFDNTSIQAEPAIFFHPMAIENFRTYLKNKYSPETLKKRFGFSDVRYVEPPAYNRPLSTIDDPLLQEWTDFRCQQLADYYGEMEKYIRGLNPEVAVENNPHGLTGKNTMWDQGIDFPKLLSHTDFFWTEGEETNLTNEGILISKIRTFKIAQTLNNRVFTYSGKSKLDMAEAMAYNRQGMGMVGDFQAGDELPEGQRNYIKFFLKNFDYYHHIRNVADVAVLRSYATMAFNNDQPYQGTFLFEQALIQKKIPFDIIFDDNLKDISRYKVLVLADQECLNNEKLDLIRSFVNQGGGLVATERTSLFTEWRQRKPKFGLNDLFKVEVPQRSEKDKLNVPLQKNQVGKGRVVYIPRVKPSIPKPEAAAMSGQYWKLPLNWEELIESVQWASGNSLSLSIEAPLSVTMELTEKEDKSALILHLVNFDSKNALVQNIKVDVQAPEGKKIAKVAVMTPDGRDDKILSFKENGKHVVYTVPQLSVYNMVVMKLK
ncbi:MAG: beta-galactosidase [Prolixibacteraceae bacterium]|nr:beta-galactosidase [Prolixibacteraceae bacterium]